MERKRSIELLALSQVYLTEIIGVLNEHCSIGTQEVRLKILEDAIYHSCMAVLRWTRNFFLHYLAIARLRLKHIGCHTFNESPTGE